jgi:hypothetical protein
MPMFSAAIAFQGDVGLIDQIERSALNTAERVGFVVVTLGRDERDSRCFVSQRCC